MATQTKFEIPTITVVEHDFSNRTDVDLTEDQPIGLSTLR